MVSLLNANSTGLTVALRALYNAAGAGAVALLTTYSVTDSWEDALIVAAITALGALGFRGGVEGLADMRRDAEGKRLPGDVGMEPR